MSRSGFTILELVIVLTLIGVLMGVAFPQTKQIITRETVRAARRTVTSQLARTRAVAAHRGCSAALHIDRTTSQVWITACKISGAGIDTVGTIDNIAQRHGVAFTSDGDSVVVTPQGLALGSTWTTLTFSKSGFSQRLGVSPIGRAMW